MESTASKGAGVVCRPTAPRLRPGCVPTIAASLIGPAPATAVSSRKCGGEGDCATVWAVAELHPVPIYLEEGLEVRAVTTMLWADEPAALGLRGTDRDGHDTLVLGYDAPIPFLRPRAKSEMELTPVERYRVDSRARGQRDPFHSIRLPPVDPPDFLAVTAPGSASVGLECTRLADETRIMAQNQLRWLGAEILSRPGELFQAIRGCVVFFQAIGEHGQVLPPRAPNPALVEAVDLMAVLDPTITSIQDSSPPKPFAPGTVQQTASGTSGMSVVRLPERHRPSSFMNRAGFELRLGYTTRHTKASVLELLQGIVTRKDRPENSILLITAGGADRDGVLHPAEELVAEVLLGALEGPLDPPKHLTQVVLHRWMTGDAWDLYPTLSRLVRPATEVPLLRAPNQQLALAYPAVPTDLLRMERNEPCRCGSGRKAKHCHLRL